MTTLKEIVGNPNLLVPILGRRGFFHSMDDAKYLRYCYKGYLGRELDLDNPKGFNEKLQWLKLHDRNPLYTTLVDKYLVKQWVADKIGPEYVTKTYAVWERAEDIDISDLPERFVLKTNHDSGGVCVCRDRSKFDLGAAKKKLAKHLKANFYWGGREWPYKNVKPLVFAEEYLEPDPVKKDLVDYKIMCFGGRARCVFTCEGRSTGDLRVDFYDLDWNHLPFTRHYPNAEAFCSRPPELEKMIRLSEELSRGIPFVRSDFYEVDRNLYFGELTFYPGSGFEEFDPESWDKTLGSLIELPFGGGVLVSDNVILWMRVSSEGSQSNPKVMRDYKFFCFEGNPLFLYVSEGFEDPANAKVVFLKTDWSRAPFARTDHKAYDVIPEKPNTFDEMMGLSKRLSAGIPFVRVDFFEHGGHPRFSEMTFYHCSGFMAFEPPEWDFEVGKLLPLPRGIG